MIPAIPALEETLEDKTTNIVLAREEQEVPQEEDPLASLKKLDEFTSPVHNPLGVCFCFNLIFIGLAGSLIALIVLGETGTYVYALIVSSFLLWVAVNVLLLEIWKRTQDKPTKKDD